MPNPQPLAHDYQSKKLTVAIVGGGIGTEHAQAFHALSDRYELLAVCDLDRALAGRLAIDCHIPRVTTDFSELLRIDDLDVIDLCTPSYLHHPQALAALEAGKHVICEKPVAGSLQQIDELIAVEARSGKCLMPISQTRFGTGVQKLRYLRSLGLTGPALLTTSETARRRRPEYYAGWHGKWTTELGGALVTLGIHALDVCLAVLGPARGVSAHTATLVNPIETEDCLSASLQMADGSLLSFSVTTGSARENDRYRFCFRDLVAESNPEPYRTTSDPWGFYGDSTEIDARIQAALASFQPAPEGFQAQFEGFYRAVTEDAPLPITLQEARLALEVITAIYASAETGQAVTLPIGQDHPKYSGWKPG